MAAHFRASTPVLTVLALMGIIAPARRGMAQDQFVMPDRNNDAVYRLRDADHNGVLANPGEVFLYFSAANTAGTIGPMNPTAQAVSVCRAVTLGDQGVASVFLFKDANDDGDALDAGESIVFAGPGNASAISLAFPSGAAFDSQCRLYVVNAGNASGADGIYRLVDGNGDGDAMDAGEITPFVTDGPSGMGAGNGPYSPQEIFFDGNDVGYLHNSSTNLHGIFRFVDANASGRADDAGEFTPYFTSANLSGVTVSAGFGMEPDRAHAGSMYFQQTATGAIDQVYRITDSNNDLDANDAGEALLVYENAATGFTGVDILSLTDGDVLVTDNSGITVARLHDGNRDGDFLDAGESYSMLGGPGTIVQSRQVDILPRAGDVDMDGFVAVNDLLAIITTWGPSSGCTRSDIDCSGQIDVNDLLAIITHWD